MKPEIILTAAGHAGTQATLMAEFDAHKFWEAPDKKQFVENLWSVSQQSGQYRYYQECVYLLGLLATAGRYQYDWASPATGEAAN